MKLPNRILEDASNQPTAAQAYNLSGTAQTGFRTFASQLTNGDTTVVLAEEVDANGNPAGAWELATCTYTTGTPNTLASRTLIESSSGALIDWSVVAATPRLSVVQAGQPLMQHINQTVVSSDVSSVNFEGYFRAGHNYLLTCKELRGGASDSSYSVPQAEFSRSGVYDTTAGDYKSNGASNGSAWLYLGDTATMPIAEQNYSGQLYGAYTDLDWFVDFAMYINRPADTGTYTTMFGHFFGARSPGNPGFFGAQHTYKAAVDGIRFRITGSPNIGAGTFDLYELGGPLV